uniref:Uncharacterized protein n=1 Tax=Fusarium oxysporum (strain Fo5176) TaxID=660025 RepID=A0A0D2YJ63_FUSOF
MLPTVYDKVKKSGLDADERDDKGWGLGALLNKWHIGGIYGMILAFYSGDINLHRRARWRAKQYKTLNSDKYLGYFR